MKKIIGMLVMAGILLAMISTSAVADPITELEEDAAISEEAGIVEQYNNTDLVSEKKMKMRKLTRQWISKDGLLQNVPQKKYAKLRGIWGLAGDNESDGYFGGRIIRRGKVAVFKGLYNKTDNESFGKIFGIMKHGYFNGRVVNPDGESVKITGLYKINRENKTFKMHWLLPRCSGWAVAKILPAEG